MFLIAVVIITLYALNHAVYQEKDVEKRIVTRDLARSGSRGEVPRHRLPPLAAARDLPCRSGISSI